MTQAGIAAVLSLIIPGVGQIYNGDFLRGYFLANRNARTLDRQRRDAWMDLSCDSSVHCPLTR